MTCSASSDHLTLLPFYKEQSNFKEIQAFVDIFRNFEIQNFSLWKPFHFALPKFNDTFLPKHLKQIKQISMDSLIQEIQSVQPIVSDSSDKYSFSFVQILASIMGGICFITGLVIILYCCKSRNKNKKNVRINLSKDLAMNSVPKDVLQPLLPTTQASQAIQPTSVVTQPTPVAIPPKPVLSLLATAAMPSTSIMGTIEKYNFMMH